MENLFLTKIDIKKVRHIENISIPLSKEKRKHLILTGKNGSGKTSVLEALVKHLEYVVSNDYDTKENYNKSLEFWNKKLQEYRVSEDSEKIRMEIQEAKKYIEFYEEKLNNWSSGAVSNCTSFVSLRDRYKQGNFILAYYAAERRFCVEEYENIEKIQLEKTYSITEMPGEKFTKYLVDLKATQAFTKDSEKIQRIEKWFENLEGILRMVFDDQSLRLIFDDESFQFSIYESGREVFDFNTMSSGYAAVLDIINDLIIRMEAKMKLRFGFDMEGIVLIDEIETHLHLDLQKKIFPILTGLFPNLQFIITTHSPFVLNSLDDAAIYDLEKKMLVSNGLQNLPYEGIVEGYFGVDRLSDELKKKFYRYRELVKKEELCDEEYAEIEELEYYLDEIPDYMATEITTEYSRLKLEFSNRE